MSETVPRPDKIKQLAYGVFPAYAMVAAMELDLFSPLSRHAKSAADLAAELQVSVAKLAVLLDALVSAELLERNDELYRNSAEAEEFLVRGKGNYLGAMHQFYRGLWRAVSKTAESVRTNEPKAKRAWSSSREDLLNFFRGQFHSSYAAGKNLAQLLSLSDAQSLLDVGGGSGGVSMALCEQYSSLQSTLVDLPEVIAVTPEFVKQSSASERIQLLAADLTAAPIEGYFDVAIMRSLIQVLSLEQAQAILKNTYASLAPVGSLYVVGRIRQNNRLAPASAVAHSLVFLNTYDEGQAYTEEEYFTWLRQAGFCNLNIQYEITQDGSSMITAEKRDS